MREYSKKNESQSRTLDSNPKASRQAPIDVILQRYKERNIQRELDEEDEPLQGKFDTAQCEEINQDNLLQGEFESVPTGEQEAIQREEKPNNTGIPDNLKSGIESLSGYSMDDVQVHYNSSKPAQLQALAYAQGTDIHVAPGQEQHLPHEVWHVVQQKQGRVQPTTQLQGVNVNDNEGLEKEADVMGRKAVQKIDKKGNYYVKHRTFYSTNLPIQKEDLVEKIVLEEEDLGEVKKDIDIAMEYIKDKIMSWAEESQLVANKLASKGRDAWVYAGFFSRNKTLHQHLEGWNNTWSIEKSCGLLLDLGNALRSLCQQQTIMNSTMKESRKEGHEIDRSSDWAKDYVPTGAKLQSGASATTGNLLRILHHLELKNIDQIEAIMIGVIKYWRDGSIIKWLRGEFHTASEVWAVYMYYVEEYYDQT